MIANLHTFGLTTRPKGVRYGRMELKRFFVLKICQMRTLIVALYRHKLVGFVSLFFRHG
jgi:hypothetical protein